MSQHLGGVVKVLGPFVMSLRVCRRILDLWLSIFGCSFYSHLRLLSTPKHVINSNTNLYCFVIVLLFDCCKVKARIKKKKKMYCVLHNFVSHLQLYFCQFLNLHLRCWHSPPPNTHTHSPQTLETPFIHTAAAWMKRERSRSLAQPLLSYFPPSVNKTAQAKQLSLAASHDGSTVRQHGRHLCLAKQAAHGSLPAGRRPLFVF